MIDYIWIVHHRTTLQIVSCNHL